MVTKLSLSTSTAGATIFCTVSDLDFITPAHNGPAAGPNTLVYSVPFTVLRGSKRYFMAMAYRAGMTDSIVESYSIDYGADVPVMEAAMERPRLANNGEIAYDTSGNMRQYDGWTYVYDAQNRLTSAIKQGTVALFAYDGKNRQIMRSINTIVVYSVWDGWELIQEYGLESSTEPTATYLQGAQGVIKSWTSTNVIYYYQDKLGSTTHIADASGHLLESYRYDLYGKPSYYDASQPPQSLNASTYNISDLYAGERWIGELALYDLRNRFMSPELGGFLQTDPIGFKGDASNLYRYCHNAPEDFNDPMGTYAQGSGWNKDNWEKYQSAQEKAAKVTGGAADRIETAMKNGGKELSALKKDFERIYGPGSATKANLRQVGNTLWGMETALRDNGQLGYYANAATNANAIAHGGSKDSAAWTFPSDTHSIYVNTDHTNFGKPGLVGNVIHESSHNLGLIDAKSDRGAKAYRHGSLTDQAYFKQLPFKEPDKALQNADTSIRAYLWAALRRGCPVIFLALHAALKAGRSPPVSGEFPPPIPRCCGAASAPGARRWWAGARSVPSGTAAGAGCLALPPPWRHCGHWPATTPTLVAYIRRCNSPCCELVSITVFSCGLLWVLTPSPLSVKSGQPQRDPHLPPAAFRALPI